MNTLQQNIHVIVQLQYLTPPATEFLKYHRFQKKLLFITSLSSLRCTCWRSYTLLLFCQVLLLCVKSCLPPLHNRSYARSRYMLKIHQQTSSVRDSLKPLMPSCCFTLVFFSSMLLWELAHDLKICILPTLLAQHLQAPAKRSQHITTLLGATRCTRLATMLQRVARWKSN